MNFVQYFQSIRYLFCGLAVAAGVLGGGLSEAATYYTAKNGNDSNTCVQAQSQTTPKLTINSAVKCLVAGDTLYVKSGVYSEALMNVIPGGTSWSKPVTVAAFSGDIVTIQPPTGSYRVLDFTGASRQYIIINGFILDGLNVLANVVKITGNSTVGFAHHIRIQNSEVKNGKDAGILVTAGDPTGQTGCCNDFINLRVHSNGTTDFNQGFYITSANNLIEGSRVYSNKSNGISVYNAAFASANNNIVRNNIFYNNGTSGTRGNGITVSSGTGNIVYNNIVYGNMGGISVYGGSNAQIYNNTIYGNVGVTNNSSDYGIEIVSFSSNTTLRNNISFNNKGAQIRDDAFNTQKSNNLISDPFFIDPLKANFALKTGSPAINTGIAVALVTTDYAGTPRPQGSSYDIGAYEYITIGTPITPPKNLRIVANW